MTRTMGWVEIERSESGSKEVKSSQCRHTAAFKVSGVVERFGVLVFSSLFGDSNTVVSSRWGLGGLRHFSGALRPFRHISCGLPSGSAIWCPSSLRCAEAHYSGFVGRASSMWLQGEYGIFLFCSPRFWVVGFFARAFLLGPRGASKSSVENLKYSP